MSCWQIKVICSDRTNYAFDYVPDIWLKIGDNLPIAHSLSYNIQEFGRKWSYNNRDTAQRSLPCIFMFRRNLPHIDITRKCEKSCTVAFNRIFDYDDVIKLKNKFHMYCRELSQLQHIKIWENIGPKVTEIQNKGRFDLWPSFA